MNLLDIKQYIQQVKMTNLSQLCAHFKCDSDLLRSMLCHWTRKGCIRKTTKKAGCDACQMCHPLAIEMYEWVK